MAFGYTLLVKDARFVESSMVSAAKTGILEQQLVLFHQQVLAIKPDLSASQGCAELEAVIALGSVIFQQINKTEQRIRDDWNAKRHTLDVNVAREIATVYGRWYESAGRLLPLIKRCAGIGYRLEGAEALIDACRYARLPALHFDELLELELRHADAAEASH